MIYDLSLRNLLLFDGSHMEYTTNVSTKRKVDMFVFIAIFQMHLTLVDVGFMSFSDITPYGGNTH